MTPAKAPPRLPVPIPFAPTTPELRALRIVLLRGYDAAAEEEGVTRSAITKRLIGLYARLEDEPRPGRFSAALEAAKAVGWLVIPDEDTCQHLIPANECRVVGCS